MDTVFSGSLLLLLLRLLLLVRTTDGVFNVKSISKRVVEVTPGQMLSVTCPSRATGEKDMVTWETEDGEFLGLGEVYLIGSVHRSTNLVCRRRNLRTGTMISAQVRVQLMKRSQADGRVYLRRYEWTNISCVDSPKDDYDFVWTNPKHFQVSKDNFLRIQLVKDSDFGNYVCRPYSNIGLLPIKEVNILENTNGPTEVPWRALEDLQMKVAPGGLIVSLCLPDDHPGGVKVRWRAPDGSIFEGNRLQKRARGRADFGDYFCEAVSNAGGRWRRRVEVHNEASDKSVNILQNDVPSWLPWVKKKPPLSTMMPTTTPQQTDFTATMSSATTRPRPRTTRSRSRPTVIRMQKVELVIDKRAAQPTQCPDPGHVGRYQGFTQSRVFWIYKNQIVSEGPTLDRWYTENLFGNYECWRIYKNAAGDVRKIQIPVTRVEMPTSATQPSTTTRPRTTRSRSRTTVIRMQKVEFVIDKRAAQPTQCPDPGHVGRYQGFTQSRVFWVYKNQIVSEGPTLHQWYTENLFANYECWRIYKNAAGDVRKIQIPVTLVEMPTSATQQPFPTTRKSRKLRKPIAADPTRIYELAPQTIKVLQNETVMLVCPTEASVTATPLNFTLRSVRHTWRDQHGIIGNETFIFVSTQKSAKTSDMQYSCQHDFYDQHGRIVSLFKNYTLRSSSNQIELPVGERQDIMVLRFTKLRLLCVSNSREGDSYEWVPPAGQPLSSSNLLEHFVNDDLDFGEYKCTVWRADGTSQLRKVQVNEKFSKRAKTVTRRRFEWLNLMCIDDPPSGITFEWVHPKRTVVSNENRLRLQLKETADFGHYVCYARTSRGSLPPTDFMVLEYPVSPAGRATPQPPITQIPVFVVHGKTERMVRLRLGQWAVLRCSDNVKPDETFEWVNPNSYIISSENTLKWPLKRELDFGHYVCHVYVANVHIRSRHFSVLKIGDYRDYPETKKGAVYMRRNEMTHFQCLESPQGNYLFEWINPEGFVVSQQNVIEVQLLKVSDFGHYTCKAISEDGEVLGRNIFIEEEKTDLLTQDPTTPEIIKVSQLQIINVTCKEKPPPLTSFVWLDERGNTRSTSNRLSITVNGDKDIGRFVCTAKSLNGSLTSRVVIIVMRPFGLQMTPESGVIRACNGQASASALCWIENRETAPLWRSLPEDASRSRVQTSVLSGHRARLSLLNVDTSDDGRVFECYSRASQLQRKVIVKVDACQSCVCLPSETRCQNNGNVPPQKQCISVNWICDGEDDCGNGYDERNCPYREIDLRGEQCEGQTMRCPGSDKIIPKGFWCDKEVDCDGGEDEMACQTPQILLPSNIRRVEVRLGGPVSLKCTAIGVPPPKLIWRFNWDCLPPGVRATCACSKQDALYTTRCTLTIAQVMREHLGIFTCEAINNRGRAFAEDYRLVQR